MLQEQSEIFFYIIKLVLSGTAAFLAIMLWNRIKDSAWTCIIAGAVTGYSGLVYQLLVKLGMVGYRGPSVFGIGLFDLLFYIVPSLFFIIALIIMNIRNR